MFTGIIKEVGKVERIIKGSNLTKLGLVSKIVYQDCNISDSISCNGVCLTLVKKEKSLLFFEAVKSTLDKSNLKKLKIGELVNLETALKLQDKLGGHFVLGHVDSEAKLKKVIKKSNYWSLEVDLPLSFKKNIVENGSVAIDGISLTVKKVFPRSFTVDVIPFTYENTNLKYKRVGDWLNVEFDYLLKKVESKK